MTLCCEQTWTLVEVGEFMFISDFSVSLCATKNVRGLSIGETGFIFVKSTQDQARRHTCCTYIVSLVVNTASNIA